MRLVSDGQDIVYRCNICGSKNRLASGGFHRETALCEKCGANARFRGIIHVLGELLGTGGRACLRDWPQRPEVSGIGMSDWPGYAALLAEKFSYENSFYDRPPQLDIQNLTAAQQGKYDFVISSDVFEHVLPPLQQGFDNLFALLKPGGGLVFSVPYTRDPQTVEHFPALHQFEILAFQGQQVLVNRNAAGALEVYDNLIFHGGEGATLEMRLFCEADVLERLARAGFEEIRVHDQPQLSCGFYWPELTSPDPAAPTLYAYIISARRPHAAGRERR